MFRVRVATRGCAAGFTLAASGCTGQSRAQAPEPAPRVARRPLRVLITGFHDWRELEGNVWRCRDNPSCRLIYGAACPTPPIERRGPLVAALAAQGLDASFDFVTMPTLWSTAAGLDLLAYDVVVHMGLGVYDSHTTLLLECGAYNERRGTDASGEFRTCVTHRKMGPQPGSWEVVDVLF